MNEVKLLKRIVTNPKIMLGKPVIKGTRLTVELIVEKVAYGISEEEGGGVKVISGAPTCR